MIRVTVAQTLLRTIDYKSKKDGSPQQLRIQTAYAHTLDEQGNAPPYPEKFEIILARDQAPHGPGDYQLHPSAVYIDREGRMACTPRLTPLQKRPVSA